MTYVFDNSWEKERDRLATLEQIWDPGSIRVLDALGVADGWRCLEVGGGGGSMTGWLSERTGPTGHVVATDIDTRFLDALDLPNVEVHRHDISKDQIVWEGFDLIHSRAVIEHLPEKLSALRKLYAALKPGGWMVIEDFDWLSGNFPTGDSKTFFKINEAVFTLMEAAGYQKDYGRRLPADLAEIGLTDLGAEGRNLYVQGGSRQIGFYWLALERFRHGLVGSGLLTEEEIDEAQAEMMDPASGSITPVVVTAWGRKS
ncbi:MAG: trans-aconitate 2-methyltransferase [Actinomycetota bacterium]